MGLDSSPFIASIRGGTLLLRRAVVAARKERAGEGTNAIISLSTCGCGEGAGDDRYDGGKIVVREWPDGSCDLAVLF